MLKFKNNKTGVVDSDINSNNQDIGSDKNKSIKTKIQNKNTNFNETNSANNNNFNEINLNVDSNKVATSLILELSVKKANFNKQLLRVQRDCKDCSNNALKTVKEKLKEISNLQTKYDLNKQFLSGEPVIYDVRPKINKLLKEIEDAKLMYGVDFCESHTDLKHELKDKQIEIQSLEETIKLCFNKTSV